MRKAFVLMTALPPTKGHLNLIKFASRLDVDEVKVILCTQPDEPYVMERHVALMAATMHLENVEIKNMYEQIEQDCDAPGFWDMWAGIMKRYDAEAGDYVVASEPYGKAVADLFDGVFMPYDMKRSFNHIKATNVRISPMLRFSDIIPEFQKFLLTRVTIFGAESTGKTTLAHNLCSEYGYKNVFEYARPMLEETSPEINVPVMECIWKGQKALQDHVRFDLEDSPVIIQDTDLFSTVGYWAQPHWEADLGPVPERLISDAQRNKSDLYIILRSNIPFEEDPIRYGGDKRESSDEFWEGIAKTFNLPYIVVDSDSPGERKRLAHKHILELVRDKANSLWYERQHND